MKSIKRIKQNDKTDQSEPKGRIRPQLKEAIRLMVEEGQTILQAAESIGYQANSLIVALKKPHVAAYKTGISRAFVDCEKERSFQKLVWLRDNASSERVSLDAAKTIAAMDERFTRAPIAIKHSGNINHTITPGYIIDLCDGMYPPDLDEEDETIVDGRILVDVAED